MVSSKLSSFLSLKDKNNVAVSSWAEETGKPGFAKCRICSCEVKFSGGSRELLKHSERQKHINNTPKRETTTQLSLTQCKGSTE